jgi:hypothetical protein
MGLVSGIRKKPIPDPGPGVKKAPDPGSAALVFNVMLVVNIRRRAACLRRWRATWPAWRAGSQARAELRQPETPGTSPFPLFATSSSQAFCPIHPSFSAYSPFLRSGSVLSIHVLPHPYIFYYTLLWIRITLIRILLFI